MHLERRGAGYGGRGEVFLRGRPLNVTDLGFGPDGAMYLVTGGRKTQSALYRVRHSSGTMSPEYTRTTRRLLEPTWDDLGSLDPHRRHYARIHYERSVEQVGDAIPWRDQALEESTPLRAFTALTALVNRSPAKECGAIVERLNRLMPSARTASEKLTGLRAYAICLEQTDQLPSELLASARETLQRLYPDESPETVTPVGMGGPVNHRLAELLVTLESSTVAERTLPLAAGGTVAGRTSSLPARLAECEGRVVA